jgi:hypothetical protein
MRLQAMPHTQEATAGPARHGIRVGFVRVTCNACPRAPSSEVGGPPVGLSKKVLGSPFVLGGSGWKDSG